MKIPEEVIVKFVEENFEYKWTTTHDELRINSPFQMDKKFHLYINPKKGMFIDYKTGLQGSFSGFIKEYMDFHSYKEAEDYLFKNYFDIKTLVKKPTITEQFRATKSLELPKNIKFFKNGAISLSGRKALKYLSERGFSMEKIRDYGLGYIFDGEFKGRIFVPFLEHGQIVYFLTRSFTDSPLRYMYPKDTDSKNYVFNFDRLNETIGVTEGAFDAMYLEYPVCTAALSTTVSSAQVKKIFSNPNVNNIILIPDNDLMSYRSIKKNWETFIQNQPIGRKIKYYLYELKGKKDINEAKVKTIHLNECDELTPSFFLYLDRKLYPYRDERKNISPINK